VALRDKLNQNQGLVIGAVCVVIVAALAVTILSLRGEGGKLNGPRYRPDKDFFSDDDGHSWFIDDANKIPPFSHGGRQAYRAAMFLDQNDKKFVGYLEGYDPATKEKMESDLKSGKTLGEVLQDNAPNVKKPNGGAWVKPKNGRPTYEYGQVVTPIAPDKKGRVKSARLFVSDGDLAEAQGQQ